MTDAAAAPAPAAAPSTSALLSGDPSATAPPAAAPAPAGDVAAAVQAAADAAQGKGAPSPIAWLPNAPAELVGYVQNKGWTDPQQVLEGYQNLEKLRGVPAERLLTLPAADADQAQRDAFYEKLGRPKDAGGYEFKLEGADEAFDAGLKQTFHKHGLSAEQAKGVISDYAAMAADAQAKQEQLRLETVQSEHNALLREWGAAAQQNLQQAGHVAKQLGLSNEEIDAMGSALGHKRALSLLQNIASRSGEAGFVTDGERSALNNAMTPAQATARLNELMADKDWVKRLQTGGTGSKEFAERRRLIEFQVAGR